MLKGQESKDRIIVLIACSASGEKSQPLDIGKVQALVVSQEGLSACQSHTVPTKAWMTSDIFQQWLDKQNSNMKREKAAPSCYLLTTVLYSDVKLVFLPPNTTD